MRKLSYAIAGAALAALIAGPAFAESSKFAASLSDATLVADQGDFGPTKILDINIKTANKSDLLIGVSLETSLFTQTKAKGRNGSGGHRDRFWRDRGVCRG